MKPLRKRFEEARKNIGLPWEIIERDYILSWVLAGIGGNEKLQSGLVFKGGTALKKCYFGKHRFSEDLDFTARGSTPRGDELEKEIQRSCRLATELAQNFSPLELKVESYYSALSRKYSVKHVIASSEGAWQSRGYGIYSKQ